MNILLRYIVLYVALPVYIRCRRVMDILLLYIVLQCMFHFRFTLCVGVL